MSKFVALVANFLSLIPGPWQPFFIAAAVVINAAYADQQRRNANRKARDAWNAQVQGQTTMFKSGVAPREIVYGRVPKSGPVVAAFSTGNNLQYLWMVIAVAGHEIDQFESVYFNDKLVTLDGNNNAIAGAGFKTETVSITETHMVPGSGPFTTTLGNAPLGGTIIAVLPGIPGEAGNPDIPVTPVSVVGTTVTWDAANAGQVIQVTYNFSRTTSYARVWFHLGTDTQTVNTDLSAAVPSQWDSNHRLRGIAYAVVRLEYDQNVWQGGIPNIFFVVRGKRVYDPRLDTTVGGSGSHRANDPTTWAWSSNPALCARDFIVYSAGLIAPASKVPNSFVVTAANVCDEDVQITAEGATQKRYECHGVISMAEDRTDALGKIESSMAGKCDYTQGQWRIRAGAFLTPTVTINENNLTHGDIEIVPTLTRQNLINACKAEFLNAARDYVLDQAPEWSSPTHLAEDGGRPLVANITLPMTTDVVMAQRLSKIHVLSTRDALTIKLACNLSMYNVAIGGTVYVKLPRYGWDTLNAGAGKPFRIKGRQFSPQLGVVLTLQEESATLYAWTYEERVVVDHTANTNLPRPFDVPEPTIVGVESGANHYVMLGDGTIVPRIRVQLGPINNQFVLQGGWFEMEYSFGGQNPPQWQSAQSVSATSSFLYISPAVDGRVYLIRVRAVNSVGQWSDWVLTSHLVTAKAVGPIPPDSFTLTLTGANLRRFTWQYSSTVINDLAGFEIRFQSGATITWATATVLDFIPYPEQPTNLGGVYETNNPANGTWSFEIRAKNRSGIFGSTGRTLLNQTIAAAGIPPTGSVGEPQLGANLNLVRIVATVSGLPAPSGSESLVVLALDTDKLYRWNGSAWVAAVPAADVTGQLTNAQIADLAAAKITGQIVTTQITDNAITTPKIVAGAVTTAKVAATAITAEKLTVGQRDDIVTLIENSDFTDYTGTNSGPAALKGWSAYNPGGFAGATWGRNFNNGGGWNWGLGGAYLYAAADTPGQQFGIVQRVPFVASEGTAFEFHFSGSVHRARARIVVNWLDSGGTFISQSQAITAAPNTVVGTYDASSPVVWGSGTVPAGATQADFYILINEINPSDGYVLIHRVHFALMPPGASATNPTRWRPTSIVKIHGGGIMAETVTANQIAANAITTDKITANAITSGKIAAAQISTDKLIVGSVSANIVSEMVIDNNYFGGLQDNVTVTLPSISILASGGYVRYQGHVTIYTVCAGIGPTVYGLRVSCILYNAETGTPLGTGQSHMVNIDTSILNESSSSFQVTYLHQPAPGIRTYELRVQFETYGPGGTYIKRLDYFNYQFTHNLQEIKV